MVNEPCRFPVHGTPCGKASATVWLWVVPELYLCRAHGGITATEVPVGPVSSIERYLARAKEAV